MMISAIPDESTFGVSYGQLMDLERHKDCLLEVRRNDVSRRY